LRPSWRHFLSYFSQFFVQLCWLSKYFFSPFNFFLK
jgi:hypothetical protein